MRKSIYWLSGVFFLFLGMTGQAHAFGKGKAKVTLTSVKTTFGDAQFSGTGCNNDTAAFMVSPDEEEISLSYDEMIVEAGDGTNRTYHKKHCQAVIPVYAPPGQQIIITVADFRGAATIPQDIGAMGRLQMKMRLQDSKRINDGSIINKNFSRGFDDNYTERREWVLNTGCGGTMNLIIDQQIEAWTGRNKMYSTVALDTTDVSNPVDQNGNYKPRTIKVEKKKC